MRRDDQRPARDRSGRYAVEQRCDACSKPIHGEHFTDDEVCAGGDGPGFYLCGRKRCVATYVDLPLAERRARFARVRAAAALKLPRVELSASTREHLELQRRIADQRERARATSCPLCGGEMPCEEHLEALRDHGLDD